MELQFGFERPDAYRGGYVAIGNFDGVHQGHQQIARQLEQRAHHDNAPAVVLTFDPPPVALLAPGRVPPRLTTVADKAALLRQYGVDCVIAFPTDRNLLQLTAEEFFQFIVRDELQARGLVEGPNFRFGHGRSGDIHTLQSLCDGHGLRLDIVAPSVDTDGHVISSTDVRRALTEGRVRDARAMLQRPYSVEGTVAEGARRGRTLGFPTANLHDIPVMLPGDGVYAAIGTCDGRRFAAAVHVGPNPTFGEDARKVEAHLLDFADDLYGSRLKVEFEERVRGTQRFENAEALRAQLLSDIAQVRKIIPEANISA